MESLRAEWDSNAADWIAWARSPECDHAFWRMNLPTLLKLLPPPRGAALDLGCGEGRVARALRERGYDVRGIDGSPALVRAAREADPGFDAQAVVAEAARPLEPGGALCLSVLHPLSTHEKTPGASYFDTVRYRETIEAHDRRLTLNDTHRPLGAYFAALSDAGFLVERVVEPRPDAGYLAAVPAVAHWCERPAFLHVRARLAA